MIDAGNIEVGKVYKATVEDIVGNMEGISHIEEGFPVYFKGVRLNEKGKTVKIRITGVKKYHCIGEKM